MGETKCSAKSWSEFYLLFESSAVCRTYFDHLVPSAIKNKLERVASKNLETCQQSWVWDIPMMTKVRLYARHKLL